MKGIILLLIFVAGLARLEAHAFLKDANPGVGSTIQTSPSEVRIRFTENIEPAVSSIQVFDASGKEVDKRDLHLDRSDHALLHVSLPPARRGNLQGRVARSFCRYTRDKRKLHFPGRSLGIRTEKNLMVTALIITRAVHIAASILIAGIFTFDLVTLGLTGRSESNDLHEVERRLFRLALWSLIAALLSALFGFGSKSRA